MRLLTVTDAWHPQVNGVVRTLETVARHLVGLGHRVEIITPCEFRTVRLPTYPEIRLAIDAFSQLPKMIDAIAPDTIHIATEGPLGIAARRYCLKRHISFTTAYHARFPEYLALRAPVPLHWSYAFLRRFHAPSNAVMVTTASMESVLRERGFVNLRRWSLGVDTELFHPRDKAFLLDCRPISLYVGRVAPEKNLENFLSLDLPGTKYVVGDGPSLRSLRKANPKVRFIGAKYGEELASFYAAADVFVFPSRTDTFGLVILEALASGLPVAAYPVAGPLDLIGSEPVGSLNENLARAVEIALTIPPIQCRSYALKYSWQTTAQQFVDIVSCKGHERADAAE